jgi:hypothetical protein
MAAKKASWQHAKLCLGSGLVHIIGSNSALDVGTTATGREEKSRKPSVVFVSVI